MKNEFIDLSVKLQKVLGKEGLFVIPFEEPGLPFFSSLTREQKDVILEQMQTLLEIAQDLQAHNLKVTEPANLIRTFFKKFNLHAPARVVDSITKHDIVDVWNLDSRLIIASFNFFDICTYSLEELFCRPWAELFSRDNDIHIQIYQLCRSLLNGEITQPVDTTYIPQHKVRETYAPEKHYAVLQPRIFSPVYAGDKLFGFMSVNRIIKLEPEKVLRLLDE
ncbi:hypothetical protein [Pseudobdellovibrio sp. HCB154]|uniref:hypothetical protein n=1 Tax=Pseudobdellovibrio sp. HCB154 TaxID=3386277 RepID=UPI003916FF4A